LVILTNFLVTLTYFLVIWTCFLVILTHFLVILTHFLIILSLFGHFNSFFGHFNSFFGHFKSLFGHFNSFRLSKQLLTCCLCSADFMCSTNFLGVLNCCLHTGQNGRHSCLHTWIRHSAVWWGRVPLSAVSSLSFSCVFSPCVALCVDGGWHHLWSGSDRCHTSVSFQTVGPWQHHNTQTQLINTLNATEPWRHKITVCAPEKGQLQMFSVVQSEDFNLGVSFLCFSL